MKLCSNCSEPITVENRVVAGYTADGVTPTYRPDCKSCHSERTWNRVKEKRLEASPERYHQCDDCYFIWCHARGLYRGRLACPKCQRMVTT